MAFIDMQSEISGSVPKIPWDFAGTLVNRAWRDVRRQSLWSFLLFESNWTSPPIVNAGTVTVTQGSASAVFNAAAATAIDAIGFVPSPVTQRQFRVGIGTIYNIIAWDTLTLTATLDRNYQEATAAGSAYSIFQNYYAAPYEDFWTWITIRDMLNFNNLITTASRAEIDQRDPQRTIYYIPTHVVPYQQDQNANSSTYRFPLFEMWGLPTFVLTYQLYGLRKGTDLVNPTDTLPPAIGEDVVIAKAREYAYGWAEANKGDLPRNAGSDYRFLIQDAKADYQRLFREYRRQDRALVDNFHTKCRVGWSMPNLWGFYSSVAGYASRGAAW